MLITADFDVYTNINNLLVYIIEIIHNDKSALNLCLLSLILLKVDKIALITSASKIKTTNKEMLKFI